MVIRAVLCFVLILFAVNPAALASNYVMHHLGTFGRAYDINNHNQVVGERSDPTISGFVWSPVTGTTYLSGLISASGINDNGIIVGNSVNNVYYLDNGVRVPISAGYVNDINNANQIIGGESYSAWIWDSVRGKRTMQTLGGWWTEAVCINASGQVAGFGRTAANEHHAIYWDASGSITDLGAILGQTSEALGINDLGQIVGECNNLNKGFVWDPVNGARYDGLNYCVPDDINNRGEVVGRYYTNGGYHAFYWKNGLLIDLDDLNPGNFSWATAINENGWISGMAWDSEMNLHAVVWEPVPEPSSILTLVTALLGTGVCAMRNRRI